MSQHVARLTNALCAFCFATAPALHRGCVGQSASCLPRGTHIPTRPPTHTSTESHRPTSFNQYAGLSICLLRPAFQPPTCACRRARPASRLAMRTSPPRLSARPRLLPSATGIKTPVATAITPASIPPPGAASFGARAIWPSTRGHRLLPPTATRSAGSLL